MTPHDHAVAQTKEWIRATDTLDHLNQLRSELSSKMLSADGVMAAIYKREKELK